MPSATPSPFQEIDIVFQDEHIVVANKPPGLLCVPGLSDPDNLFDRVKTHFANARVVHRLDMATSGLVIFALSHPAQKALGQMFEKKRINKRYRAVVEGRLGSDTIEIVAPLICDWDNRPKQIVNWHSGKFAHSYCRVIERCEEYTTVELSPITGRTHQLRLHMQYIGHPIIGDRLYHPKYADSVLGDSETQGLLLHAEHLVFPHPITKTVVKLTCEARFNRAGRRN